MHRSPGRRKIKAIAIAAAVVGLILAWVAWAYVAHRRLQTAIAEIYARHEPVYFSDLILPPLPNNQNSAFYYQQGFAAMSTSVWPPSASNLVYANYPPFPPAWHQMIDQAMRANKAVFPLVRKATKLSGANWGARGSPPTTNGTVPNWRNWLNRLSASRGLANLLGDAILYAHLNSDDAEAIQYAFDALHLADAVEQRGFLIGELVGVGIKAVATDRIQAIAPDLQVQGDSNAPHAASRAAVMQLINHLLDDKQELRSRKEAMIAERALDFDHAMLVRDKATVLRPMLDLDAVRVLDNGESMVRAASQSNYPAAQASCPAAYAAPNWNPIRLSRLASDMTGRWGRTVDTEFRGVGAMRLAAVSLAVRLYRADHRQWPANLKILVGPYLPKVPEDPFYATHQPVGYVLLRAPNGRVRPMIYFDPSGLPTLGGPPNTPCVGWIDFASRQWRDLSDWWITPAAAKPSKP